MQSIETHTTRAPERIERFARYLSIVGHPFIVLPASVAAISVLRGGAPHAAAALAGLFVIVSGLVLLGMKSGRFNDFDVSDRRRRPSFYLLVIAGTAALGIWLRHDPEAFGACAIAAAVLILCGSLNRWMKPSLHAAFALYAVGLWAAWSLSAAVVTIPVAAAVAWSRVRLRRHTTKEVLVGTAIGLVAACSFVILVKNLAPKTLDAAHVSAAFHVDVVTPRRASPRAITRGGGNEHGRHHSSDWNQGAALEGLCSAGNDRGGLELVDAGDERRLPARREREGLLPLTHG